MQHMKCIFISVKIIQGESKEMPEGKKMAIKLIFLNTGFIKLSEGYRKLQLMCPFASCDIDVNIMQQHSRLINILKVNQAINTTISM